MKFKPMIAKLAVLLLGTSGLLAASVNVAWDASPDAATPGRIAGYNLYYGLINFASVPVGVQTNAVISNLLPSKLYNFSVTAFDQSGQQSEFSPAIAYRSDTNNQNQINLAWDPSPDAATPGKVLGYIIHYGYAVTNKLSGLGTNTTVTGLASGAPYFFSVAAYDDNGMESELSNLMIYNPDTLNVSGGQVAGTPAPVGGLGVRTVTGDFTIMPSPGSGGTTSGNTAANSTNNVSTNLPPVQPQRITGVPPRLSVTYANGQPQFKLWGTVGANFAIQKTTSPASPDTWVTITNLSLTNAVVDAGEPKTPTVLDKAFTPAMDSWSGDKAEDGGLVFYRAVMPYDYAILADQALKPQGYDTRLVAIRLAALESYAVCYVTSEAAYIDFDDATYELTLQRSGSTLRDIANSVAGLLNENWTSASEFTFAAGAKTLVATVVKTDTTTGVAPQTAGSSIKIDF